MNSDKNEIIDLPINRRSHRKYLHKNISDNVF